MSTILAISSYVARGPIGLGAIVPTLGGLGYNVTGLPTVLYSNHPGHERYARQDVPAKTLADMIDALDVQGWLGETSAILTGYLPTRDHVAEAAQAIRRVKALCPDAIYLCDPVLGDDPKGLYLDPVAAGAIRDTLIPIADILKPNRFELAWLTGESADSLHDAIIASRRLAVPDVVVTSVPGADCHIANLLVTKNACWATSVRQLAPVPHGIGDMMGALVLGYHLSGLPMHEVLGRATASVTAVARKSAGLDALPISEEREDWLDPAETIDVRLIEP